MAPIIDITSGDLTTEPTSVIINPTSRNLDFGGQVSKAILQKGSANIQKASANLSNQMKNDGYVIVAADNLPSTYVMSVDCTVDVGNLSGILNKALPEMVRKGIDSISIPAIGAGAQGKDPDTVAKFLIGSLFKFFKDSKGANLDKIDQVRVIIYQNPALLDKFRSEFDGQQGQEGAHIRHVGLLNVQRQAVPRGGDGASPHIRRVAAQTGLQWGTVRQDDPGMPAIQQRAQQAGHHIVRVRRAQFAETLAAEALRNLSVAGGGGAVADGARARNDSASEDEGGDFAVVFRNRAGVPEYQVDYEED